MERIKPHKAIPTCFTKPQLRSLSSAYNMQTRATDKKAAICDKLVTEIPKHRCMHSSTVLVTVSNKMLRLRSRSANNDLCSCCQQASTDGDQWLQCSICHRWYHRYCAEITDDAEWIRLQQPDVEFRCHLC